MVISDLLIFAGVVSAVMGMWPTAIALAALAWVVFKVAGQ